MSGGSGFASNRKFRTAVLVLLIVGLILVSALLPENSNSSSARRGGGKPRPSSAPVASTVVQRGTWVSDLTPPLSKQTLGRATWSFFHTTAGHYPEFPNTEQQRAAEQLFSSAATLYACEACAEHFRAYLSEHPVRAGSRDELTLWLCTFHNAVNERLGKPLFNCDRRHEYWDDDPLEDCGCSGQAPPEFTQIPAAVARDAAAAAAQQV